MKKVICLLSVMFVSTVVNAQIISCPGNLTYKMMDLEFDNGQTWTSLTSTYGEDRTKIHTIIPASPATVYDCANDDKTDSAIVGGADGLSSVTTGIMFKELSSTPWITFKCFCKLNKNLLNGCETIIHNYTTDYAIGFIKFKNTNHPVYANCNNGEAKIIIKNLSDGIAFIK